MESLIALRTNEGRFPMVSQMCPKGTRRFQHSCTNEAYQLIGLATNAFMLGACLDGEKLFGTVLAPTGNRSKSCNEEIRCCQKNFVEN